MELQYSDLQNGLRLVRLAGTLDINGVSQVEMRFTGHCAGEKAQVIVDLSEVEFLASIGIRLLMLNAKSLASRGGRMVILSPRPEVLRVLEMTGIPAIIPISSTLESAEAVLHHARGSSK